MKALTSLEPKPFKAFRDNYLAVVMMVVALLLSSVLSAQSDELKYSKINGYGFLYKRWGADSILMVPLSSSPHTPYRAGAIRYKAADSTLQLWTGYQWNSILTGVGSGIDTMYMLNDTTLAIETPDQNFFAVIKGQNIANAALTADGDYIQDWADKWFFLHDLKALEMTQNRVDPNYPGNIKVFRFYSDSTVDDTPLRLTWGLKDVNDGATDSVHFEVLSQLPVTSFTHWGHSGNRYVELDLRGNVIDPTIEMIASSETKASSIILGSTTYINPNDSLKIKAIPAATAPKILGFRDISGSNVGTVVAMDIPAGATLSNVGSGYRLVKTASGQIKTVENTNTVVWDSASNTLKPNVDTSYISTLSDLKDTAAAIRASAGGSQNLDQVLTVGNTTTREIISTADITGDSSLFKNFLFTRSGRVGSTTLSTLQPLPVFGSSITVGYGAVSYAAIMASDWVQVAVTNNGINGSGISTATPNNLYGRISTLPNYTSNHYGLIMEGGINDFILGADTTVYKAQFGEIVDSARIIRSFPTGKIFLISPPYSPNFTGDSIYIGINQRVAALHGGVAIDIWHPMRAAYISGHTDIIQSDSLHPTLAGQEIIARTIALAANTGSYYGNLDVSGSDTVRHNRITYGNNTTYGDIITTGSITQPTISGGAIRIKNPGQSNGNYQDLRFVPDLAYWGGSIKDSFFLRHTIANSYASTFSLYRKSDNTSWRVLHINPSVQLLLGSDASDPPTLDYTVGLGATYMTSGLAGNFKIDGNASADAQRLRIYKNSGGLDVAAVGFNSTYGLMLGSSVTAGTTIGDYSSVDGTTFTGVMNFPHNNLYNVLIGSTTDNTVGKLQVNGKITVSTHALGSNSDSALIWDRSTKEYKVAKINTGSTPTWESVMTAGADFSSAHTSAFGANAWTITGTQSSTAAFNVNNTGNGVAVSGTTSGTGTAATFSNSSSGAGITGSSSSGFGANITSTTGLPLRIKATPSSTNTVVTSFRGIRGTSSTAAIGMGNAWDMQLTDDGGNDITTARFSSVFTDATTASPDADFNILTITNGSLTNKFTIKPTGQIQESLYGSGTFTVTPATTPVYSSTGVKGERIAPKIYTALISATAGNDPTVTVLGTNEIGTIVWTRNSSGNYTGTLTGAFTSNKTWMTINRGGAVGSGFVNGWLFSDTADAIQLRTQDNAGSNVDAFSNIPIEIKVYP